MSKHTKEPWEVKYVQGRPFIAAKPYEGHPYFGCTTTIEVMSDEEYPTKEADAHRIVACVNACAGIPTEQLASVVEQNKRLRAALELISKKHEWQINFGFSPPFMYAEIRALTKAALAGGENGSR